ncbi:unnamed protein product [Durusdinium trenchii]|uniref:Mitochondrial (AK 4) (Adenylate kinase 3-like) (Adenylate kinase isoenzyme 4) (GTP:AMP phosphotransferase AK4) n=2 Tax=Durusdinium trenchii TaxID=1381693 RepID=A0ABP0S6Y4_9DINO
MASQICKLDQVLRRAFARCKTTLIMGPPGGGKGTISKKLIKDFHFHHVSAGDLLRHQVRVGTPHGIQARTYMESGTLVPDDLVLEMFMNEVSKLTSSRVLLDGFPRTSVQATALDKECHVDIAINLSLPNEEIVRRISSRWIHSPSGRTYAYDYNPPKVEGQDDVTGEPLVQRDDDKPEAVRARLQEYDKQTRPLLDFYKAKGCLHEFDGTGFPDLVAKDRRSDAIYLSLKPFMEASLAT